MNICLHVLNACLVSKYLANHKGFILPLGNISTQYTLKTRFIISDSGCQSIFQTVW